MTSINKTILTARHKSLSSTRTLSSPSRGL
nr:MAG TPA: hypothetical protein [Caudoviricetes sp.]